MIRRSSRRGRGRGHGSGRTRLVAGFTPGDVPAGENDPVNEGIVESSTHENQTHPHVGHANTIVRVRSLGAKSFNGSEDPPEAESWLIKLERIFDMMRCLEEDRLSFATFLLEDRAYHWWQTVERRYQGHAALTWAIFRKEFYDHYFPAVYQDIKRSEFLRLVQGSMSVEEYEKKFLDLSRFAISAVGDERERCKRFEEGLRFEIRTTVTASRYTEFAEVVETAKRVEHNISEGRRSWTEGGSSSRPPKRGSHTNYSVGVQKNQSISSRGDQRQAAGYSSAQPSTSCPSCGSNHQGQCRVGDRVCYLYGQPGHIRGFCPTLSQGDSFARGTAPQYQSHAGPVQGQRDMQTGGSISKSQATIPSQRGQPGRPCTQARVFALTQ
ncbi:hypothetical protein KPL70_021042 [Citrus sinensis]|nr:hypothetical protein KPL70_021042 [Citrus sinensis]